MKIISLSSEIEMVHVLHDLSRKRRRHWLRQIRRRCDCPRVVEQARALYEGCVSINIELLGFYVARQFIRRMLENEAVE